MGARLALLATYKATLAAEPPSRGSNPTRHKPAPLKPPPSPTQPFQISFIPSQVKSTHQNHSVVYRTHPQAPKMKRQTTAAHSTTGAAKRVTFALSTFACTKDPKHGTYTGLVEICDGHPVVPGCPVCAEEYMAQRAAAYRSTNGAGPGAGQDK
ncbi:hypothetical protein H634G_09556 [Metarhizium anisopliae BRIP 53293]|uniref:Uncharacterized protein n=1 Tax=Metarhizium anisopliae BRIP 53293 TaxID=1291518 RepID=A0A0D9NRH9_METAN|nr:hypothetical protein H634G_09556 [Metarhizium anisopliae BRIP 53293]KJK91567.1 hypothetical protein H633G_04571 [Metarhizium anisopliae BRIP 53284]